MTLRGIGGWLLPTRFIASHVAPRAACDARALAHWEHWWRSVEQPCGPATGLRTLFDVAAMPLFARLGFRARQPQFVAGSATATLVTPEQHTVALLVRPWSQRPPTVWRDATAAARNCGAQWCCVFAPPLLSIIPASGHAARRSLDFTLPDVIHPASLATFLSLAHADTFDRRALEHWLALATTEQARVRSDLQHAVMDALGEFTTVLQRRKSAVPALDEALTLVYRILFLLFAESRNLVPHHHPWYREHYTLSSLCQEALHTTPPRGLWDGFAAISRLSRQGGHVDTLQVFPFNGHLFSTQSAPSLESTRGNGQPSRESDTRDAVLARALIGLATRREPTGRVAISYADLGVEELGAIYERLLDTDGTRKHTGTFYTPQPLADLVVQRTLAPLVEGLSADAILTLRVLDPAMGSGAFLVAALRYLSNAYELALIKDGRCVAADLTEAEHANVRRRVAQQCLFGVDANPVAVQVARLSIWLATLAHAKPLSFLDHRLRVGNSLVGASPSDLWRQPGTTTHVLPLFDGTRSHLEVMLRHVVPTLTSLATRADDTVADVRRKEHAWAALRDESHPLSRWRLALSLWCAQWFWPANERRPSPAEIRAAADECVHDRRVLSRDQISHWLAIAQQVEREHRCFHWALEFPDVFHDVDGTTRRHPGFDAIVGNPPWEMVRRDPGHSASATRRDSLVTFVRESGHFPLCQRGHLNLYQPFVERSLALVRPAGRVGLIVPWGFAVDDGAAALRTAIVDAGALDTIVGCDNARGLFPIHRGLRFAVVVATPGGTPHDTHARFGVASTEVLDAMTALPEDALPTRLDKTMLVRLGGATRRIPDLRHDDDLKWLSDVMNAHPAMSTEAGWRARFSRELNATDDSDAFSGTSGRDHLPVADGKHIEPFVAHTDQCGRFIARRVAEQRLPDRRFARARLVYRDVSGVGNRFTLIAAVMPADVVTTHTLFCLQGDWPLQRLHFLCGVFNSDVMNRVVRMLMGSHVTTSLVERLPVPAWRLTPRHRRIAAAARRLSTPTLPAATRVRLIARLNSDIEALYDLERRRPAI
jgi:hypothetical protein